MRKSPTLSFSLIFTLLFSGLSHAQKSGGDEVAQKKQETTLTEVIVTDSLPASVLLGRAVAWVKLENPKYRKSEGVTSSGKAECLASFPVQPRELNPMVDYTGKITMKVQIECKDSKYRYTVSDIRHVSKSGRVNGGSIDNLVAECGSMTMDGVTWRKIKAQALHNAATVVEDIKLNMDREPEAAAKDEW